MIKTCNLGIFVAAFIAALSLQTGALCQEWDKKLLSSIEQRFQQEGPTVVVEYDLDYRFLFIKLMNLATARVETSKGAWLNSATGRRQKARYVKANIDSNDDPESEDRGRVSTHREIFALFDMPEVETLLYVKKANEYVNPLFKTPKKAKYREVYDLQHDPLRFIRRDYLNDKVQTNLVGATELARQGEEIATTLQIISDVYAERREMLDEDSDVIIDVNIDGVVTPFEIITEKDNAPVRIDDEKVECLKAVIRPTEEADGRGRKAIVWAISFRDLAKLKDDADLMKVAEATKQWSMAPVAADYGLALGYIRASLKSITLKEAGQAAE